MVAAALAGAALGLRAAPTAPYRERSIERIAGVEGRLAEGQAQEPDPRREHERRVGQLEEVVDVSRR